MVELKHSRHQAASMGQTSSQIDPIKDPEPDEERGAMPLESQYSGPPRKKAKRTRKDWVGNESQDEERARTLLQLSEDVGSNARLASSNEDDLAASAQLWAESSQVHLHDSSAIENEGGKTRSGLNGRPSDGKRKHEAISEKLANFDDDRDVTDTWPSKKSKQTIGYGRSRLKQPTFSLDDIPTDDETIATFFQEYENDFANPASPASTQVEAIETESQMQQLAATVDRDELNFPLQSTYQLPSSDDPTSSPHKKIKKKRKWRAESIPETNNDNSQEQTNGTGQHDFGIDFAAFDAYFNCQQDGSANMSTLHTDCDSHLDPDLIRQNQIYTPVEEISEAELDSVCQPQTDQAKLVEGSSSAQSSERMEDTSDIISDDTAGNVSVVNGVSQDDEDPPNPPGIEKPPPHSSPEVLSSRASGSEAGPSTSSSQSSLRQKTPPALAKACQPRGNKTQQGGKKGKNYDPPLEQIAQKGGVFTETEISKLDAFRDAYCLENEMTPYQFNQLVQAGARGNSNARWLWQQAHELLPYRTRMSTMRFCKRRYHNFSARGTWTQSEDESLKQAVAEKGTSWKAVGEMIERFPEDCRDRYRNYHINAENRNREKWTEAEVQNLCRAVYNCMTVMKEERAKARNEKFKGREVPESESETDQEIIEMKLINWQAVSDRMGPAGGGRSRLQCSFKWGQLKMADVKRYWKELKEAQQREKNSGNQEGRVQSNRLWRYKKALKKLRNLKVGDRYDFLQALASCGAEQEGNIPWRLLGNEEFRSRWTTIERKAALEKFKREVPETERMDYRDLVNRLLTQLMATSIDKLDERWNPERDGDLSLPKRRSMTQKERKRQWEEIQRQWAERHQSWLRSRQSWAESRQSFPAGDETSESSDARVVEETPEKDSARHSTEASSDDAHEASVNEEGDTGPNVPVDSEIEDSTDELFQGSDPDVSQELDNELDSSK